MRQLCPRRLGHLVQTKSASILVGLLLALLALCMAIKSAKFEAELSSWIQRTGRIEAEMSAVNAALGDGSGANSLLLLQASRQQHADVLTVDALMVHLEAMAIATHVTVDLFDVSWSLKDLCFAPTLPDIEGAHVGLMLENLMPCAIKTPLDCFWEGSKLLGPQPPVSFSSLGPKLKWSSLNPLPMVEALQRNYPHASFSYSTLIDWMQRVGITTGYQLKPCLDPTDPECPVTSPNKSPGSELHVAKTLTGGCHGLAANLMHWHEEELIGGVTRNKSGHVTGASALQSTIQLMGEKDMYDFWRKSSKVQDIDSWSADKAKYVLEMWQLRYKEELAQFAKTSSASSSYKIHAMTTKSMLEPIDVKSLLDLTNVQLCFVLMTVVTCLIYPNFQSDEDSLDFQISVGRLSTTILALVNSIIVGLTFVASLGLSSFMNMPVNIATAHILPPLALCYGFWQSITVAIVYSQNLKLVRLKELTSKCLEELLPIILIGSTACTLSLIVAYAMWPVPATQVFASQAITFTIISTLTAIVLMPAMFTTFILHHLERRQSQESPPDYFSVCNQNVRSESRTDSPGKLSLFCKSNDKDRQAKAAADEKADEEFLSRIKDDLKNIKADPRPSTNVNFSAQLDVNGLRTSFRVSATQAGSISNSQTNLADNRESQEAPNENHGQHLECIPSKDHEQNSDFTDRCPSSISDGEFELEKEESYEHENRPTSHINFFAEFLARQLTSNKFVQFLIIFMKLCTSIAILSYASNVRYGLQLRDIVFQGTPEYESFMLQEKYFPLYNTLAITRGNFDYPSNQRLLYEYHRNLENVNGVIKEEDDSKPKFWLNYFRDWLVELQLKFDIDKNNSAITSDGWTPDTSDAAKLAYKLLAQTGRSDNPVDKNQIFTNRLVDSQGIINPKAFYYYLTAWVVNDAFTYSISGANFRPEPKIWNGKADDLRIEKARPLVYTQIPLLVRLPSSHDNLKTVLDIRSVSQAFEQLGLNNFPTGIPFIFWDQYINLDYAYYAAVAVSLMLTYLSAALVTSNWSIAAIVSLPAHLTLIELYGLMGVLSVPFNSILAVLLISSSGISVFQTIHLATVFESIEGDVPSRASESLKLRIRMVLSNSILFIVCVIIFRNSKLDFMLKYSTLLICLAIINLFNSILITPILLSVFGVKPTESDEEAPRIKRTASPRRVTGKKIKGFKGRKYPRVQSEISLSTISEESESNLNDFKFDFSIRCHK